MRNLIKIEKSTNEIARSTTFAKGAALASITLPSVIGVIPGKALVASFIEHIESNGETWE